MRTLIRAIFILPLAIVLFLPSIFMEWLLGKSWKQAILIQKDCFWDWLIMNK